MKILVCGGRKYDDRKKVFLILDIFNVAHSVTKIAHGGAQGADALADAWARENFKALSIFRADWASEGKAAGPRRNARMLELFRPDVVVAFPGGRGTADMIRQARAAGVRVIIID